jgi:prolyl-tRNA synthetase
MKYCDLNIQTQREFPNNARTAGFGLLVRAGYITRENEILPLGKQVIEKLGELSKEIPFFSQIELPIIDNANEIFFESSVGSQEILHCEKCDYVERKEIAKAKKSPYSQETPLPLEKVETPAANTIEALANFLNIPKEKTAKALMYTRISDGKFIFVVVRGDMQMSEAKLKNLVGEIRQATMEEIVGAGAVAGYASPVGLNAKRALIIVDDLIPQSFNLVAGANDAGFHLFNTNSGRDYIPELTEDLTLANDGDACSMCGGTLTQHYAEVLASHGEFFFDQILLALAETHHDDKGLTLPKSAAPFDIYLMHVPGKTINTLEKAEEIYRSLQGAEISVLFDDRDERAGVKFNDADLIGCPIRVTVGEKALQNGMVELKPRKEKENKLILLEKIIEEMQR